jgi:hypothetical protein
MRVLILSASIVLAACSTPYQEMGLSGGVSAKQMTANTYRIEARGNGYTGSSDVKDYAMLKAAEITRASGNTHFVIIDAADASHQGQVVIPGSAQTNVYGYGNYATAQTTYTPAQAISIHKPGQDMFIRMVSIKPGEVPPHGAISADEIIQFVGSRVKSG